MWARKSRKNLTGKISDKWPSGGAPPRPLTGFGPVFISPKAGLHYFHLMGVHRTIKIAIAHAHPTLVECLF